MQISSNILALSVWNNYTGNIYKYETSLSKLSTGLRIRNAGDDPSGLALSERLRVQSRNTAAAASNVENRINFLQTADSWMQKIHDMLGRMGELAVEANDDTKSDTDKDVLQQEFVGLQDEIKRITTGSSAAGKFNGVTLFNGPTIVQQVGADGGQVYSSTGIDLQSTNSDDLDGAGDGTATWGNLIDGSLADQAAGLIGIGSDSEHDADGAITAINDGIDYLSTKRSEIGAELQRMAHTLDGLTVYAENVTAAESRIRNVDIAKETVELSKYSILREVSTAMMAQANQIPAGILKLFGL